MAVFILFFVDRIRKKGETLWHEDSGTLLQHFESQDIKVDKDSHKRIGRDPLLTLYRRYPWFSWNTHTQSVTQSFTHSVSHSPSFHQYRLKSSVCLARLTSSTSSYFSLLLSPRYRPSRWKSVHILSQYHRNELNQSMPNARYGIFSNGTQRMGEERTFTVTCPWRVTHRPSSLVFVEWKGDTQEWIASRPKGSHTQFMNWGPLALQEELIGVHLDDT